MSALSVAVIAGGPSSEAAVSRASAAAVATALEQAGHRPAVLELDFDLGATLRTEDFDVVFPVTHGSVGEDGCLQGLLEVLGIAYVGSGVLASALAASKPHAKAMFRIAGLPVAGDALVHRSDPLDARAREVRELLGGALVVKPASGGSAIGVTRVTEESSDQVLVEALTRALEVDSCVLVERLLMGSEVTCGVLECEGQAPRPLPPTLILSRAAEWYNFEAKYAVGGSEHRCPASLPTAVTERIQQLAVAVHQALGARDLSRVDFIVGCEDDPSSITVLELNSLPGMTVTSLYPEAAGVAGLEFPKLCDMLVRSALRRPHRAAPTAVPLP
jgi:D-alanine-D-alanine ligase